MVDAAARTLVDDHGGDLVAAWPVDAGGGAAVGVVIPVVGGESCAEDVGG